MHVGRSILRVAAVAAAVTSVVAGHAVRRADAISFWDEEKPAPAASAEAAPAAPAADPAAPLPLASLPDFTTIAEQLGRSVVNISTSAKVEAPQAQERRGDPFGGGGQVPEDFWEPFERFFGPMPKQPHTERSLGSGFIISKDGIVLTNNHVIENADEIIVKLNDDSEHKATVIGRDPKTDIAVIKVEAPDLTPVTLGNSEALRVGEWVVAIGNPFGLEHTVTAGIVSAKGRFIGQGSYDQFIQTDVAINPGNSGGPLINLRGEVVGINTAIFSRGGGNIGIGFAIPINLAKELLPQLEEKGKVTRGWLGVLIQKVTPDIADTLELDKARGALVADVMDEGPAKDAGIQVGDVIVEFDGHAVNESNELPFLVARTPVGKSVEVTVIRGTERKSMTVTIEELTDEGGEPEAGSEDTLGMTVQPLTPEIAESLGLEEGIKGVVVSGVEPGSSAEDAGLRRGDIILEVNRTPVGDLGSYRKAIGDVKEGKTILLLVRRGANTIFVPLKP
jgi:serine protease Do